MKATCSIRPLFRTVFAFAWTVLALFPLSASAIDAGDTTPPQILGVPSGIGPVEANGSGGAGVFFQPPLAFDAADGPVPVFCMPSSGSFFPIGQTQVFCTAMDSHGNSAHAEFFVTVVDTQPPMISEVPLDIHEVATAPDGANVYFQAPFAFDAADGLVPVFCEPSSGSFFPIGQTRVSCTATDSHGNSAHAEFFVTVETPQDTTPPETFITDGPKDYSRGDVYIYFYGEDNVGVAGFESSLDGAEFSEVVSKDFGSILLTGLSEGEHTFSLRARDTAGNVDPTPATITWTVDTTPPDIVVPKGGFTPLVLHADQPYKGGYLAALLPDYTKQVTARDSSGAPVKLYQKYGAGTLLPVGEWIITVFASDAAGNSATVQFTIQVVAGNSAPKVAVDGGASSELTVLHSFNSGSVAVAAAPVAEEQPGEVSVEVPAEAAVAAGEPGGRVLWGIGGNLRGTTKSGGTFGRGTVWQRTSEGVFSVLASFGSQDGYSPQGDIAEGDEGVLFGTTPFGGANDAGTFWKLTQDGTLTTLASFDFAATGYYPYGGVVRGSDGAFYGVATYGGVNGYGTVFRVTAAGELSVIGEFDYATTGAYPQGALVVGTD